MKLNNRHKNRDVAELNLPAMVDVILLLLIFFMCTRSFNDPEKSIKSQLLQKGVTLSNEIDDIEPIEITLRKTHSGVMLDCDGKKYSSFKSLSSTLRKLRNIVDAKVIIKSESQVPFRYVVETLDRCKAAEFSNVGLSTVELSR